jgi:hypothetical protein
MAEGILQIEDAPIVGVHFAFPPSVAISLDELRLPGERDGIELKALTLITEVVLEEPDGVRRI